MKLLERLSDNISSKENYCLFYYCVEVSSVGNENEIYYN